MSGSSCAPDQKELSHRFVNQAALDPCLKPSAFDHIDGWANDDHLAAFAAFVVSAKQMAQKVYKTRRLGLCSHKLYEVGQRALQQDDIMSQLAFEKGSDGKRSGAEEAAQKKARQFFEQNFTPFIIAPQEQGFVTGFFEPLIDASLQRSERFSIPLYRRPDDLVDLTDENRPSFLPSDCRFALKNPDGSLAAYFDRSAIEQGALAGRGLELAWLENKVDAYFIHVQGSARLSLPNGGCMRITYAAKSGHDYTSIAKILCQQIGVKPSDMTADRLAQWMHHHPEKIDALTGHNQSYIFFKEVTGLMDDEGPIAAAKTPLIAGRSLAVDRLLHCFGSPLWVAIQEALPFEPKSFARLMVAQDTGSAIVGPARGDIFMGTGKDAGVQAGRIRHQALMYLLVPKL